jgi:hypothetical protein
VGSIHTLPANCDGNGACPAANTASCGSYVCSTTSPTCLNTCGSDHDCTNNLTCLKTNNRCGSKLGAGETCKADSDCSTGLVCSSEKVCCDHSCTGACQSCKVSGKSGTCSNIAWGSTPRDTTTCPAAATGACGDTGKCDGSGGCQIKTNGSACDDGNPSTAGDICTNGVCAGVDHCINVTCPLPAQCHTAVCDHATGLCSNPIQTNGTACNDGNSSTVGDVCNKGVCAGVDHCIGVTCPSPAQCHTAGVCDHSTGLCSNPNQADGTACNDGDANTAVDVCTKGVCAGVDHCKGVICAALDQCHVVGTCDHATGCSNPTQADGTVCDDGIECTTGDVCTAGTCAGTSVCGALTCNPQTGLCK